MDAATAYESAITTHFLWPGELKSVPIDEIPSCKPPLRLISCHALSRPHFTNSGQVTSENSTEYVTMTTICHRFHASEIIESNWGLSKYPNRTQETYSPLALETPTKETSGDRYSTCNNNTKQPDGGYIVYSNIGKLYNWNNTDINGTWWAMLKTDSWKAFDVSTWPEWGFQPSSRSSFQCVVQPAKYRVTYHSPPGLNSRHLTYLPVGTLI